MEYLNDGPMNFQGGFGEGNKLGNCKNCGGNSYRLELTGVEDPDQPDGRGKTYRCTRCHELAEEA